MAVIVERADPDRLAPLLMAACELTDREKDVTRLVLQGETTSATEATVNTHVARILSKLQLRDRVQAVVLAYETGLVGPGATARERCGAG